MSPKIALSWLFCLYGVSFVCAAYYVVITQKENPIDALPIICLTEIEFYRGDTKRTLDSSVFKFDSPSAYFPASMCNDNDIITVDTSNGYDLYNNCKSSNFLSEQKLTIGPIYDSFDKIVIYNAIGYSNPAGFDASYRMLTASIKVTDALNNKVCLDSSFKTNQGIFTFIVNTNCAAEAPTPVPNSPPVPAPSSVLLTMPPTSQFPTPVPTLFPTGPSNPPNFSTNRPSTPTIHPTDKLVRSPTTIRPTYSMVPTNSQRPSPKPPTRPPTVAPTRVPSRIPTVTPSRVPSAIPSVSMKPTVVPSRVPTVVPSRVPSRIPTVTPSRVPSRIPSALPTVVPSRVPTVTPTVTPSRIPSAIPTVTPSRVPSAIPSISNKPNTLKPIAFKNKDESDSSSNNNNNKYDNNKKNNGDGRYENNDKQDLAMDRESSSNIHNLMSGNADTTFTQHEQHVTSSDSNDNNNETTDTDTRSEQNVFEAVVETEEQQETEEQRVDDSTAPPSVDRTRPPGLNDDMFDLFDPVMAGAKKKQQLRAQH